MSSPNGDIPLIDPSLLEGLSEEQRQEALAAAAAAKRAEERAEQRALERAMQQRAEQRKLEQERSQESRKSSNKMNGGSSVVFVSKRQRAQQQSSEPGGRTTNGVGHAKKPKTVESVNKPPATAPATYSTASSAKSNQKDGYWMNKERKAIQKTYLGTSANQEGQDEPSARQKAARDKKKRRMGSSKKTMFRFEWDNKDDTLDAHDPLYNSSGILPARKKNHRRDELEDRRSHRLTNHRSLLDKPLEQMKARDWRIFRENYEIVVKGGKAPPPLRNFREGNFHSSLLNAIENVLHYKDPTPIQRQSIPIGLQRRDLIGIAETGSGKTCAFGVPLLQYIMQLPSHIQNRVAEQGPLAVVLAPTRELALQIHGEFEKMLSRQSNIKATAVVGGQSIQNQAQQLRDGVHVVVGTPGRINDCIEMAYMVLNQCCYVVLDEADRMIDMGFAPQLESILEAMGGMLKSENEQEAYQQEAEDFQGLSSGLPKHRLTAMFSATMPLEVERLAKRYLRHPAVVSIGDQDSGKNARIVQRILFLKSASQKERALRDLVLDRRFLREKVIVFVNEKKHADGVGRMVERMGRPCVVLHGGKSQEQREENLQTFRKGGVVLVATDVAGRGLDIPDVAHVINYDLPSRSIDTYCHRIGRTGRAGKEGVATSLMSDEDESIMAALKAYLESTGNPIPDKLARHPAANVNPQGNLIQ